MKSCSLCLLLFTSLFISKSGMTDSYYLQFNAGYGIGMNKKFIDVQESMTEYGIQKFSLGQGFNLYFGIGKSWSSSFSTQISVFYLHGTARDLDISTQSIGYYYYNLYSYTFGIKPSIIFKTNFSKFTPFLEMGFLISKIKMIGDSEGIRARGSIIEEFKSKEKFVGPIAVGVGTSLGLKYSLNKSISLNAFITFNSLEFVPTESKVEEYEVGGQDIVHTLDEYYKTTKYVDHLKVISYPNHPNLDSPRELLKSKFPLSNLVFNLGVQYSL
jgi:hypothetical protein